MLTSTRFAAVGMAAALALAPLGGRAANEPVSVPVVISLTGPFALVGNRLESLRLWRALRLRAFGAALRVTSARASRKL